jgi:hypothetical protein
MWRWSVALLAVLVLAAGAGASPRGRITARLQADAFGITAGRPWTVIVLVRDGRRPFSGPLSLVASGGLGRRTYVARKTETRGRFGRESSSRVAARGR